MLDDTASTCVGVSQPLTCVSVIVKPSEPASRLVELAQNYTVTDFVVTNDDGKYAGLVPGEALRATLLRPEAAPLMVVSDLMQNNVPALAADETLDTALDKFAGHEVSSLAVVDADQRVKGMLTRTRLMREYHAALGE